MLKIDVEPITPKLLNKKTAHSAYIKHTQEEATVLRDLVEHVKSKYPLDHSLESACRYAKLIQELLTHISKTCPSVNNTDGKLVAVTPKNKDKRVRFTEPVTSSGYTITKTASTSNLVSNKPMLSSTGVKPSTSASGSQPSGNTKKDKIRQTPSSTQKNKVEAHPRKVKSSLKNKDCVVQPKGTAHVQHSKLNANSELKCVKCNGCMLSDNHDLCVLDFINNVNARKKSKSVKKSSKRKVVQIVLWYLDSGCSKHMTGDRSQLTNFVNKFLGTVKFRNDHMAKIMGYGDYQIGNVTISRVYYVEGLGHNLFSVGQFCDSNLEVAFRQHTCFIRNLEGVDLLTGSRGNNLYTLSLGDMMASSPICLLSKASKTNTPIDFSSFVLNGLKIENLTQEILLGPAFRLLKGTRSNYAELEYDFEECYKDLSEKLDWENPEGGDYPIFDLPNTLWITHENSKVQSISSTIATQYLQGGISTMTYTTSTTKTKTAKYDLPGIEDMVSNIWSPVKVAYDKYVLWGISHWREHRKSFYAYARGMQLRGDVYSIKRILAVTHVSIMRKHRYEYLEEIVVRRVDNKLYRFKEGDFSQLRINDIEDMLILVVQNRLTNLSGDDVADFAIALRMFTRSLVIQKRVKDLQLGVKSYQKQINVTKPDTTRPDIRKRHPYTPYKDPQ
ncbi:hypothetical protein Tco_0204761 [Tanacetum coccineum]